MSIKLLRLEEVKDSLCDGIRVGQIGRDKYDRYIPIDLDGNRLGAEDTHTAAHKLLKEDCVRRGLLLRQGSSIYRRA